MITIQEVTRTACLPHLGRVAIAQLWDWSPLMAALTGCKSLDEYLAQCRAEFQREWGGYADSPCDDWTPPDDD